ncbi:AAA family ATPase [Runella aurantiaca]|uniref:ATP-binding cassette domain-containing protein n=1 Tax=Runella aurantiaca TaxID=2282308 RepID=A0A369I1Q2_9BACT|nr:AAA family ATPase [Runella aurantiaca]RDB02810.1 ATP-binding cassette domain-containing protein [Runella aurantiaca]
MADKLIVKDFGPIRDAEMDIKKTTVLIGPQGSGKSTLAKLVAIMRQKKSNIITNEDLKFYSLSENYSKKNYTVDLASNQSGDLNKLTSLTQEYGTHELMKRSIFHLSSDQQIYIPAERIFFPIIIESILGLLSQRVAIPQFILEFGREYELARKNLQTLKVNYLNIEFKHEGGHDYVVFNDSESILLNESASGFQSILPMKLVIENNNGIVPTRHFIIEEPELNLYPTTQKNLIYYLADRCTKGENELMMTTHSPYVLAALNNLLFAYKVAQDHPEKAIEVEKVIPRASWLAPDEFAAYFVVDGTVRSIINPKTGLISENELDNVSDEIGDEFNQLVDIYRSKKNETVH